VIGPRFFAFAMIAGARIVALTIDRRSPDNTLVEFVVTPDEQEAGEPPKQRLTLLEFRLRLANALMTEEPLAPPPSRLTDVEAIQRHIGVRYLLLAPVFGYSLVALTLDHFGSMLRLRRDGVEELYELEEFRARIRLHVREELQRSMRGGARGTIDLARIGEAEQLAMAGEHLKVIELLGAWPAPLAIFLRTPEGQALGVEARQRIASALLLLGGACINLAELDKGHEILRLGIQYALDTAIAAKLYLRLAQSLMSMNRVAEAIGPLRRAINLGGEERVAWPLLAEALARQNHKLAALAATLEARDAGLDGAELRDWQRRVEQNLGPELSRWRDLVRDAGPDSR
jgi:tetratricopeptide (TPR) repeat protein